PAIVKSRKTSLTDPLRKPSRVSDAMTAVMMPLVPSSLRLSSLRMVIF
ncbi:MAG: hypothetical protein ACI9E1_002137, partial [Cryomorphaceae bacterium]